MGGAARGGDGAGGSARLPAERGGVGRGGGDRGAAGGGSGGEERGGGERRRRICFDGVKWWCLDFERVFVLFSCFRSVPMVEWCVLRQVTWIGRHCFYLHLATAR
jgi:hypothetical protein